MDAAINSDIEAFQYVEDMWKIIEENKDIIKKIYKDAGKSVPAELAESLGIVAAEDPRSPTGVDIGLATAASPTSPAPSASSVVLAKHPGTKRAGS